MSSRNQLQGLTGQVIIPPKRCIIGYDLKPNREEIKTIVLLDAEDCQATKMIFRVTENSSNTAKTHDHLLFD